jgi:NitT/TauT family transport system permease protein
MPRHRLFALREPLPRSTSLALGFVMPVLVLGAWCVATYGGFAPPDFLPSPTEVVRGTLQLFIEHDLGLAIWISTKRILIAFLLAAGVALSRSTGCSSPSWRRCATCRFRRSSHC